jgi:hypothetical protein
MTGTPFAWAFGRIGMFDMRGLVRLAAQSECAVASTKLTRRGHSVFCAVRRMP